MLANKFENFEVAGWGKTTGGRKAPGGYTEETWNDDLNKLNLSFVQNDNCKDQWTTRTKKLPTPSQLCATGEQFISNSCVGDSGGPLMAFNKESGITEVIGILSHGVKQCNSEKPSIYTRVAKYLNWINEFITDANK